MLVPGSVDRYGVDEVAFGRWPRQVMQYSRLKPWDVLAAPLKQLRRPDAAGRELRSKQLARMAN